MKLEAKLGALKLVLVSDAHKGGGDGADEFRRAERAYNAALAYYAECGFTLAVLGDGEELWKYHPDEVLDPKLGHPRALAREAEFHARDRYIRIVGNHDDLWRSPRILSAHLGGLFPGLEVQDAVVVALRDDTDSEVLGELFLVHGSQRTYADAGLMWISRQLLHFLVRPVQRKLGFSTATPAVDWINRRSRLEEAMFGWAARRRVVLITGHTHRPSFPGAEPQPALDLRPDDIVHALESTSDVHARAALRADLEYALAEIRRVSEPVGPDSPPCYFNTGSCSYGDGDLTAIEISDGRIRLVRWPGGDPHPRPEVLKGADRSLLEVLRDVAGEPVRPTMAAQSTATLQNSPPRRIRAALRQARRAKVSAAAVTLIVISDVQCTRAENRERHAACARFIQALDYDTLVNIGDEVDDATDVKLWQDFDAHWGVVKPVIHPVKGTDLHVPLDVWKRYYGRHTSYWSRDLGGWHLIGLDYNLPLAEGDTQYAWLDTDLETHLGAPTVIFAHLPAFSASSKHAGGVTEGIERDAFALAQRHGVELWISGHCHVYERYDRLNLDGQPDPAGIRCFTVHNAGKHYHNTESGSPHPAVHGDGTELGGLRLVLAADHYEWECLTVPGWGLVADSGEERLKGK